MGKIPEEAVEAAIAAHNKYYDDLVIYPSEEPTPEGAFHEALKGALPFLPVQGAVKKLEWELVSGDHYAEGAATHYNIYETKPGLWNSVTVKPGNVRLATNVDLEAAKAAAQADYEARILSALEPSSAREQALEEVTLERSIEQWRNMKPSEVMKGSTAQITYALEDARKDILSLARALSSPDHIADAGKVEGDGWHVEYEVYSEDEWQAASTDLDGALDYAVMYAADGFKNITVQEVRRRTLPSALASEGEE
ncbi:hypothetical protein Tb141_44 [Brucella phage Tb_141]|uniref:Uncharacterized protein n=19 Tax=Perisivirus TaxID=1984798 RepID=H2EI81_9CAUD|nr:hypothetical protein F354_gp44 [Brucella phage Tb]YP_007002109.1 hypothetical protein F355_gp43 [Brucella phage Pr]AHB81103.1 hypothetical protein Bk_43 [Brucella phage Bk]AHB81160.1 hypothetical protein Fz_44 [Brucella phage Fz]AHB81217.1 hypothetical protein R/C_43 [Brucella phage R/C]AHB81273.1 hypothetical protein S708_43 [Brucella phage S708]AHB81387.1 hypothetical protein Wb_43 [Brucella phage Wb]AKO59205.1 hypothetical protein p11sa141_44 [Brucella phage 11sa_141]AKO59264.1 hypoth